MKRRLIIPIALAIACALTTASAGYAQPQNPALSKTRLMKLLLLGDSSPQELIQAVNQKGVDFQQGTFEIHLSANQRTGFYPASRWKRVTK